MPAIKPPLVSPIGLRQVNFAVWTEDTFQIFADDLRLIYYTDKFNFFNKIRYILKSILSLIYIFYRLIE